MTERAALILWYQPGKGGSIADAYVQKCACIQREGTGMILAANKKEPVMRNDHLQGGSGEGGICLVKKTAKGQGLTYQNAVTPWRCDMNGINLTALRPRRQLLRCLFPGRWPRCRPKSARKSRK